MQPIVDQFRALDKQSRREKYCQFRSIDMFGHQTGFSVREKENFQTNVGAVISIAMYTLAGIFFFIYLFQMLDRSEPYTSNWNKYKTSNYPTIDTTNKLSAIFIVKDVVAKKHLTPKQFAENFSMWIVTKHFKAGRSKHSDPLKFHNCEKNRAYLEHHEHQGRGTADRSKKGYNQMCVDFNIPIFQNGPMDKKYNYCKLTICSVLRKTGEYI